MVPGDIPFSVSVRLTPSATGSALVSCAMVSAPSLSPIGTRNRASPFLLVKIQKVRNGTKLEAGGVSATSS